MANKRSYIRPDLKKQMPFFTAGRQVPLPEEEVSRKVGIKSATNTVELESMYRQWCLGSKDKYGYDHCPTVSFEEYCAAARERHKRDPYHDKYVKSPSSMFTQMVGPKREEVTYPDLFASRLPLSHRRQPLVAIPH